MSLCHCGCEPTKRQDTKKQWWVFCARCKHHSEPCAVEAVAVFLWEKSLSPIGCLGCGSMAMLKRNRLTARWYMFCRGCVYRTHGCHSAQGAVVRWVRQNAACNGIVLKLWQLRFEALLAEGVG